MKVALFDCFSGASGDMILGALIHAGLALSTLRKGLEGLDLDGYRLQTRRESRKGISGIRFDVKISPQKRSRNLAQISQLIRSSRLPHAVKENACAIFTNIAKAEAKIHRTRISDVHFHEIGAVDSIVDIVGACYGIHVLGLEKIYFTPLPLGSGWVRTEHGKFPVPSPATALLLRGIPSHWGAPCPGEWTTPTGAAILAHMGRCQEDFPDIVAEAVGYGVGQMNPVSHPNVLRVVVGRTQKKASQDSVWSIQTNIDDMQPQWYPPIMERLFQAGALDVWMVPIQMKKGRPGVILEVLCQEANVEKLSELLLAHTTTFGIRMQRVQRRVLDREIRMIKTPLGPVRFKVGRMHNEIVKAVPEFEDCLAVSARKNMALSEIYRVLGRV